MDKDTFARNLATMGYDETQVAAAVTIATDVQASPYVNDAGQALALLVQAIAAGYLAGEEYRALIGSNPGIARDLADILGMSPATVCLKADRREIGPALLMLAMARTAWKEG